MPGGDKARAVVRATDKVTAVLVAAAGAAWLAQRYALAPGEGTGEGSATPGAAPPPPPPETPS